MDTLAQRGWIVVAALVLLVVGATALPWQSPQTAEAQAADREVALEAGWNLVGWTGSTAIGEATASITDALLAAFTWDGPGQSFRSFNPSGPTFLNTLSDLALGDGVWINVSEASTWLQPAFGDARTVSLSAGFTLATWTGPDGMPVEEAVAEIAGNLESLFTWDAVAQNFLSFTPSAPSFLNSAKTLGFGDGVWLRMSRATEWSQPAAGAAPAPVFAVTSSAFAEGEVIPRRYTCDAQNVSPPLTLSGVPAEAVSLALILDDPDAPGGTWVHWVEFNIDPLSEIPEDVGVLGTAGLNSFGITIYGGPCPPSGTHRYFFKVFALDAILDLAPGATKAQLLAAMEGHVIAQAELMGLYSR